MKLILVACFLSISLWCSSCAGLGLTSSQADTAFDAARVTNDLSLRSSVLEEKLLAMKERLATIQAYKPPEEKLSLEEWLYIAGIASTAAGAGAVALNKHRNATAPGRVRNIIGTTGNPQP